ncbi:fimbrial protein [Erwinia sp. AnSW2-5]|uniref:fimbrial protein n=1 Tax=Erwinia sp. AnSW2-5 TaxID=3367692 RepID=UPI00385E2307
MTNGIVNFNAAVISGSMTLPFVRRAIESGVTGPTEDIHVDMGQVSEHHFPVVGETASVVMFEMRFNNQDAQKVRITFNGIASDVINGVIGTTNPTVGVQLRDESGNIVPVNEARDYPLYPGPNVIRFTSSLIATRVPVMAGPLGAIAVFTLAYM